MQICSKSTAAASPQLFPKLLEEVAGIIINCHHYARYVCVVTAGRSQSISFLGRWIQTMNFPSADDDLNEVLSSLEQAVVSPWYGGFRWQVT